MNVGEDECDDAPEVSGSSNSVVRRQAASSLSCITAVLGIVVTLLYSACFYLYSLLKHYVQSRTLHSSDSKLLFVPRI